VGLTGYSKKTVIKHLDAAEKSRLDYGRQE
jgi:hypothetical protein